MVQLLGDKKMDYKIIDVNADIKQIKVAYYHEEQLIGHYDIDVPFENNAPVPGVGLEKEIQDRAPVHMVGQNINVQSPVTEHPKLVLPPLPKIGLET
jgi:hypothetical protein